MDKSCRPYRASRYLRRTLGKSPILVAAVDVAVLDLRITQIQAERAEAGPALAHCGGNAGGHRSVTAAHRARLRRRAAAGHVAPPVLADTAIAHAPSFGSSVPGRQGDRKQQTNQPRQPDSRNAS